MSNYQGYLFGKIVNGQLVRFPDTYIVHDSYATTPNQREEIKAYRDENTRELFRITAQGKMSTFSFTTRKRLHLNEVEEIMDWFTDSEYNQEQRSIMLTYWNQETFDYETKAFYRPNLKFEIYEITETDIIYKPLTIDLIQIKE